MGVQRQDAAGQLRAPGELLPGDLAGGGPGNGIRGPQQVVQLLSGQPPGREALRELRDSRRPVTHRRQQFRGADRTGSGSSGIRVLRLADWTGQARERRDEGQGGELAGRLLTRASSRRPGEGCPSTVRATRAVKPAPSAVSPNAAGEPSRRDSR